MGDLRQCRLCVWEEFSNFLICILRSFDKNWAENDFDRKYTNLNPLRAREKGFAFKMAFDCVCHRCNKMTCVLCTQYA